MKIGTFKILILISVIAILAISGCVEERTQTGSSAGTESARSAMVQPRESVTVETTYGNITVKSSDGVVLSDEPSIIESVPDNTWIFRYKDSGYFELRCKTTDPTTLTGVFINFYGKRNAYVEGFTWEDLHSTDERGLELYYLRPITQNGFMTLHTGVINNNNYTQYYTEDYGVWDQLDDNLIPEGKSKISFTQGELDAGYRRYIMIWGDETKLS